LYIKIAVKDMWGSKTKQSKAIKKWHYKAMLVDPRKVEITIIWAETPQTYESQESLGNMASNSKTEESTVIANANIQDAEKRVKKVEPKFEITESLDVTGSDPKIEESNTVEKQDFDEADDDLENIETISDPLESNIPNGQGEACFKGIVRTLTNVEAAAEQASEISSSETAETLKTTDEVETPETYPLLPNSEWDKVEAQAESETMADLETPEQNLESMAPACSTAPNSTATVEGLKGGESMGMEVTDVYEPENCELAATEKESLNIRFLRVLEKTRSKWYNDKQLVKIVQKMEKGKNLKRKEFDRVYTHIRTYCGYN
jgi:hypothetical protein